MYSSMTEEKTWRRGGGSCDHGGREWSNVIINQGMLTATKAGEGQEQIFDPPAEVQPC